MRSAFWNPAERRVRAFWRVVIVVGLATAGVVAASLALLPDLAMPWQALASVAVDVLVPLAVVLLGARLLDRRAFASYGFRLDARWWQDLGAGVLTGLALYGLAFAVLLGAGWARVTEVLSPAAGGDGFWPVFVLAALAFMAGAFWEELLFRGVMVKNGAEGLTRRRAARPGQARPGPAGAILGAVAASTVVFAVLHVPSYAGGDLPVSRLLALWALLGLLLGLAYALTGQLAFPLGLHFGANFAINNVFGLLGEAGAGTATLVRIDIVGPEALAAIGGAVHVGVVLLGFAVLLAWVRWRRGVIALDRSLTEPPVATLEEPGRPGSAGERVAAGGGSAGRSGGRGALGLLAVALVPLVAGCQLVAGTASTVRSINEQTGARDVSIEVEGLREPTVEVAYTTSQDDEAGVRAEAEQIAEVVWHEFPVRLGGVRVAARGAPAGVGTVPFDRADLEERFGARDPALEEDVGASIRPVLLGGIAALVAAGILTAVIAVLLVRRRERQRQAA